MAFFFFIQSVNTYLHMNIFLWHKMSLYIYYSKKRTPKMPNRACLYLNKMNITVKGRNNFNKKHIIIYAEYIVCSYNLNKINLNIDSSPSNNYSLNVEYIRFIISSIKSKYSTTKLL